MIAELPAGEYEFCCWILNQDDLAQGKAIPLLPETLDLLERIRRTPWTITGLAGLKGLVAELRQDLLAADQTPAGIRTTLLYIGENYVDHISVKRLSRMAGLNINAYTVRFREATGQTPSAYIQRVRIEAGRNYCGISG